MNIVTRCKHYNFKGYKSQITISNKNLNILRIKIRKEQINAATEDNRFQSN